MPLKDKKQDAIIEAITNALKVSNGSVVKTAKLLGIDRKTIQRYTKRYNIQKEKD